MQLTELRGKYIEASATHGQDFTSWSKEHHCTSRFSPDDITASTRGFNYIFTYRQQNEPATGLSKLKLPDRPSSGTTFQDSNFQDWLFAAGDKLPARRHDDRRRGQGRQQPTIDTVQCSRASAHFPSAIYTRPPSTTTKRSIGENSEASPFQGLSRTKTTRDPGTLWHPDRLHSSGTWIQVILKTASAPATRRTAHRLRQRPGHAANVGIYSSDGV